MPFCFGVPNLLIKIINTLNVIKNNLKLSNHILNVKLFSNMYLNLIPR